MEEAGVSCTRTTSVSENADMVDYSSKSGTTTRIRRLAVVDLRRVANVEQQARVRLVGISVRHACVAEDPHLHSKRQLVPTYQKTYLWILP
jgi:hypothetical protein